MGTTREFARLLLIIQFNSDNLQLIAERDRLNKDLELAHGAIKSLEGELDSLQAGYGRGSARR